MIKKLFAALILSAGSIAFAAEDSSPLPFQFQELNLKLPNGVKGIEVSSVQASPFAVIKYGSEDRENIIMLSVEKMISDDEVKAGCSHLTLFKDVYGEAKSKCKPERVELLKRLSIKDTDHSTWEVGGISYFYSHKPGVMTLYAVTSNGELVQVMSDILNSDGARRLVAGK